VVPPESVRPLGRRSFRGGRSQCRRERTAQPRAPDKPSLCRNQHPLWDPGRRTSSGDRADHRASDTNVRRGSRPCKQAVRRTMQITTETENNQVTDIFSTNRPHCKRATFYKTTSMAAHRCVLGLSAHRWSKPQNVLTHGKCDARPKITFLASEHHYPSVVVPKLFCLVTEAGVPERLARGCTRECSGWDLNPPPLHHESNVPSLGCTACKADINE